MTDLSFRTKDGGGFSEVAFRRVPTWDILIASIPHRNDMLTQLLAELNRQYQPNIPRRWAA
jgi:hypothetical protein